MRTGSGGFFGSVFYRLNAIFSSFSFYFVGLENYEIEAIVCNVVVRARVYVWLFVFHNMAFSFEFRIPRLRSYNALWSSYLFYLYDVARTTKGQVVRQLQTESIVYRPFDLRF